MVHRSMVENNNHVIRFSHLYDVKIVVVKLLYHLILLFAIQIITLHYRNVVNLHREVLLAVHKFEKKAKAANVGVYIT